MRSVSSVRDCAHRWPMLVGVTLVLGCTSDAACVYYPCPPPQAGQLSVVTPAMVALSGVTMVVSGGATEFGPCPQTATGAVCFVDGGPGTYTVAVSAPGYKTTEVKFTATGATAGCNTCGEMDIQHLSVVLQPAA